MVRFTSFVALSGAIMAMASAGTAFAQAACTTTALPYPLANGQVANASQVMDDLRCAPVYGLANFSGNVGIGTTSPTQKLWVHDGDIWMSGNHKIGISTDGSPDPTPNVAFGGTGNDAYIANWSGSGYNTNFTVVGLNGFVGIGTTNPLQKLWVEQGDIWIGGANRRLGFSTDGSIDSTPNVAFGATGDNAYIANWNGSSYNTNLYVQGSSGNVGIGTTSPTARLHVNGSVILSQGYSTSSDARLKRDIRPLGDALGIVRKLEGVRYNWRTPEERSVGKALVLPVGQPQIGFIAQDLEKVVPEAVVAPSGEDAVYSVKESALIPVLVEAIKEQQKQIDELKAQIAQLKAGG